MNGMAFEANGGLLNKRGGAGKMLTVWAGAGDYR
jgi:hypothetical protein